MPFPYFPRKTRFALALEAYGLENCSLSQESCALMVGLKVRSGYPWLPLAEFPKSPRSVSFFEAPVQAGLITALMRSPEAKTLEHLFIGTSHDWAENASKLNSHEVYNMTAAVSALKGARLPALTKLVLGDMEMLFNGQRMTGKLGDVVHAFDATPSLTELSLTGANTFSRPVRHDRLETLQAEQSDIGCWSDPPDQATITHLFSSSLPRLTALSVHIDPWEEVTFELPEIFFSGNAFPNLVRLCFNKPAPATAARLRDWATTRGIVWRPD